MRTTRAAAVVTVLGLVGLVVSATAVLFPPGSGPSAQGYEPGSSLGAAAEGGQPGSPPERAGEGGEVGRASAAVGATRRGATPRPVRLTLAAVDIDSRVRPVGVAQDQQMQLPANPEVLGWYRFGPPPGSRSGSVVIAGHLDSKRYGLGPLVRLRGVQVGDRVDVTLVGGSKRSYTVRQVTRFDRQALPAEIFSRTGPERLRLITCGGEYDAAAGGYQQNLVITAIPR